MALSKTRSIHGSRSPHIACLVGRAPSSAMPIAPAQPKPGGETPDDATSKVVVFVFLAPGAWSGVAQGAARARQGGARARSRGGPGAPERPVHTPTCALLIVLAANKGKSVHRAVLVWNCAMQCVARRASSSRVETSTNTNFASALLAAGTCALLLRRARTACDPTGLSVPWGPTFFHAGGGFVRKRRRPKWLDVDRHQGPRHGTPWPPRPRHFVLGSVSGPCNPNGASAKNNSLHVSTQEPSPNEHSWPKKRSSSLHLTQRRLRRLH